MSMNYKTLIAPSATYGQDPESKFLQAFLATLEEYRHSKDVEVLDDVTLAYGTSSVNTIAGDFLLIIKGTEHVRLKEGDKPRIEVLQKHAQSAMLTVMGSPLTPVGGLVHLLVLVGRVGPGAKPSTFTVIVDTDAEDFEAAARRVSIELIDAAGYAYRTGRNRVPTCAHREFGAPIPTTH